MSTFTGTRKLVSYPKKKKSTQKQVVTQKVSTIARHVFQGSCEKKMVVNTTTALGFHSVSSAAWNEQLLCNPAQGTTQATRIGNRIGIVSIQIRGIICPGATAAAGDDPYNNMRIVLGMWDIATPLQTAGATLNSYISKDVTAGHDLTRKLYDKFFTLHTGGLGAVAGYVPINRPFNYSRKFKRPIQCQWDAVGVANHYLVLSMLSDSAAPSHPGIVPGYVVVKFIDA